MPDGESYHCTTCGIDTVVHNLDTRQTVLETKYTYLEKTMNENKQALQRIDTKVDHISEHIVRQNGALPRVEASLEQLLTRVRNQEESSVATNTKTKLMWGLLASLFTSIVLILIKVTTGI